MFSSLLRWLFPPAYQQDPHLLFSDHCAICQRAREEQEQENIDNMGIMEAYRESFCFVYLPCGLVGCDDCEKKVRMRMLTILLGLTLLDKLCLGDVAGNSHP